MPDKPSITMVKEFGYKGEVELWSNKYHFDGPTPSNDAEWRTLAAAIWNSERTMLSPQVRIAVVYGYVAGNETSVFQLDYREPPETSTVGTETNAGPRPPGDAAIWVRWRLPAKNSKGKWVYLRKYYHGIHFTPPDSLLEETTIAANAHAVKMKNGTLPAGVVICAPQGALGGAHKVSPYVGHRDLKRTGKRPH